MASLTERTRVVADAIRFIYEEQPSDTPDIKAARNQVHNTLVAKSVTLASELKLIDNLPENIRQNAVIKLLGKLNTEEFAVGIQSIISADKAFIRTGANAHQRDDFAQLVKNASDELNQASNHNNHLMKLSEISPELSLAVQNGHSVNNLAKLVYAGYYDNEVLSYYLPPEKDLMGGSVAHTVDAIETRAGRLVDSHEIHEWAEKQAQISHEKSSNHAALERKESYAIKAELDSAGIVPHSTDRGTAGSEGVHKHNAEWQQITDSLRAKHDANHQPHEADHRNTLPDAGNFINHHDGPGM